MLALCHSRTNHGDQRLLCSQTRGQDMHGQASGTDRSLLRLFASNEHSHAPRFSVRQKSGGSGRHRLVGSRLILLRLIHNSSISRGLQTGILPIRWYYEDCSYWRSSFDILSCFSCDSIDRGQSCSHGQVQSPHVQIAGYHSNISGRAVTID
jgi:hypothetical protein